MAAPTEEMAQLAVADGEPKPVKEKKVKEKKVKGGEKHKQGTDIR